MFEDKIIYVVSDLHMGDGGPADNFAPHKQRFVDFCNTLILPSPQATLVINGDTFEFWQASHGDVVTTYYNILSKIFDKTTFVVGNHDIDLKGFIGLPILPQFSDKLVEQLFITRNSKLIRICHGNEFDSFNDPRKSAIVGKILALAMSQFEAQKPTIGGRPSEYWFQMYVEPIMRKIVIGFSKMYGAIFARTAANRKNLLKLEEILDNYHNTHLGELVIAGHTHRAGWRGDFYVNSGAWMIPQSHYVRINLQGNVTLHEWPSQNVVYSQVDFSKYNML